ncbi:MAG TPA: hypothetical protein GXX42_01805 [Petrimonas sp.]|uniref:hypothetical protein n=1 Tax=Petrimonas sp. TaxID=2023866 RepID=UPI0009696A25|nr:MAG: hypothetical protein BGO33_00280 [Bacteroidia bacterium 43-41]HHV84539.1 hypothetical protein [Petrimonas sp.]
MNIIVEYKDTSGTISNQTHSLTRLAFAKHLAIAGQGYAPRPQKLIRTFAMLFHYSYYIQQQAFNNNRFSEPPIQFSDPTEKGQFSNLAGRAIADFLSKRIDQSIFTVNYEAAMRLRGMRLNVGRPDLLAYTQNAMFAIEAKGFSGGHKNMTIHKAQSQTGGIPVNFSVACVSYNLFSNVRCKYHDPYNDNVPYDNELLKKITQRYYSGLAEFLNERYFNFREIEIQGEDFYEIELSYKLFEKLFPEKFPFRYFWHFELLEYYQPRIILPIDIRDYAKNGITNDIKPFIFETNQNQKENLYIDNDRIGLQVRRY